MTSAAARIIVYGIVAVPIAYDIPAALLGWPTISSTMREIDRQTGSPFRWLTLLGWAAVWLHLFVRAPWGGWIDKP